MNQANKTMKEKNRNIKEHLSLYAYNRAVNEVLGQAGLIEVTANGLGEMGLDPGLDPLNRYIRMSDEEVRDEVNGMYNDYLKRLGRVLPAEKKRIRESYEELIDKALPEIHKLQEWAMCFGVVFKEEKKRIVVDVEAVKANLKDIHTRRYDYSRIKEYYEVVQGVNKAIDELRAWEKQNPVLRSIAEKGGTIFYTDKDQEQPEGYQVAPGAIKQANCTSILYDGVSEEEFFEMVRNSFELK